MLYSSYKPKVQGHGLWLFWVCGWTEIGIKTGNLRLWTWTWACKLLCCFPSLFVDLFIEPRLETLIKKCFGPEQIFKLQSSNNFMKKEIKLSSVKKKTLGARMECFRLFVENVLQMTLHDAIRGGRLMMTGFYTGKYSLFLIFRWMNWTFQIKVLLLSPRSNICKNDGSGCWGCEPCGSRIGLSGSVLIWYKICLLSSVKKLII